MDKKEKKWAKTILFGFFALVFFILSFLNNAQVAYAAACSSIASGNWNSQTTWGAIGIGCFGATGGIPGAADTVTISLGNAVVVNVASAASSLTTTASYTYTPITINSGITLSVTNAVTLRNASLNNNTNTFAVGAGTLNAGSIIINQAGGTQGNRVANMTVTTGTINCTGNFSFTGTNDRLTFSGAGTLNIGGNFSSGGTLTTVAGSVINFNGSSAQTAGVYATYNVLKSNNAAGVTLLGASTITTLTIGDVTASSIFNDGGFVITPGTGSVLNLTSGTYNLGSATVGTAWPAWGTRNISTGTTVGYVSAVAQAVSATPSYQNLTFSGAGAKTTAAGTVSVGGNLSVTSGTTTLSTNNTNVTVTGNITGTGAITSGSGTISLAGNWTNSGTFTKGTGTVTYNGGVTQTVGALTYNNLTINKGGGSASLGGAGTRVDGTLTLTAGNITTGANDVYISSTGSVSGGSTASFVVGNLRKYIATGATSKTFEIGDSSNYVPVGIDFSSVTGAGDLTASTTAGDYSLISSSGIDGGASVNRFWTLVNSGITFTNYNATFSFVAGDLDARANYANFVVGRYSSGWTYPTVGTKTSTSTQATGITGFGDFQLGNSEPAFKLIIDEGSYLKTIVGGIIRHFYYVLH